MFKNYFNIALRNLLRQKAHSIINITGLAIGITVCLLIFIWIQYQFSYDKFHTNIDNIYWQHIWSSYEGSRSSSYGTPPAVAPALKEEYPEVVRAARYLPTEGLLGYNDIQFREKIRMVDPDFLKIFTFPFVEGNPSTALNDPHSILLTEKAARKYFEDEDPLGKTIRLNNQIDLRVTGILQDLPENSTFGFKILTPIELARETHGETFIDTWYNCCFYGFVQLQDGVDYTKFNRNIAGRIEAEEPDSKLEPALFPFKKIHLYSIGGNGGLIDVVIRYALIGIAVLLIAIINFINLMTARASRRAREVGLRKVVGASRKQLLRQFYFEAFLNALIAGFLAIGLVELTLPIFRNLMHEPALSLNLFGNPLALIGIIVVVIITGILSGFYPAFVLSSFKPVKTLGADIVMRGKKSYLRRGLVVVQFAASIVLIISMSMIYKQHVFLQNKDLGFNRDHVVYFTLNKELGDKYTPIKQELLQIPGVLSVTRSTHSPSGVYWNGWGWQWEGKDPSIDPLVTYMGVSDDFLETFGMTLLQGSFYPPGATQESTSGLVINQKFADMIGLDPIVGQRITKDGKDYSVLGVVKNFLFMPAYSEIGPLVFMPIPEGRRTYVFARITGESIQPTIASMEKVWKSINPDYPFEFHFLDEDYEEMYVGEKYTADTLRFFAILAVFISCLGLFGLSSYLAERRTKEIGIRKVLGASIPGIVKLLSKEFILLVLTANIIAIPIAFVLIRSMLQNYPYRTDLSPEVFILVGVGTLMLALLTISFQSVKAALSNPSKSLRYE